MDYTTNYHLPQWVETDRVQMEDFNAAMAGIDSIIVTGHYQGNGDTKDIILGFCPRFLIISSPITGTSISQLDRYFFASGPDCTLTDRVVFLSNGFRVIDPPSESSQFPNLNSYTSYDYIAFRCWASCLTDFAS